MVHMIGLLRSTIDCIAGTTLPFPTNKYDCVPSQRTGYYTSVFKRFASQSIIALVKII
jgi:hypothetical protein